MFRFEGTSRPVKTMWVQLLLAALAANFGVAAFSVGPVGRRTRFIAGNEQKNTVSATGSVETRRLSGILGASVSATGNDKMESLRRSVDELKQVLEREYISFFDPMERDYYAPSVTFEDPLTSLAGVDSYQNNVDMLASRTLLGKVLFQDAGIILHDVSGGEISTKEDGSVEISDLTTRWTLRMTAKILPWSPTARFSGISVYKVRVGGPKCVQIYKQEDYWDSINLQDPTSRSKSSNTASNMGYVKVEKTKALGDFLNQLKPDNGFNAPSAGPELPYSLLRRGDGYEVRRYPAFIAAVTAYERRDEGYLTLGAFTTGMSPLAPAILQIPKDSRRAKKMVWPLSYETPGQTSKKEKIVEGNEDVQVIAFPERVVAVGTFSEASIEPVVRRCDADLRKSCARDGLCLVDSDEVSVEFAQYDAVYTMGKRRGEVWIELEKGTHPW